MLTQNEKEWLENRTRYHGSPPDYYFCGWCTVQGCLRQRFYLCPLSWNNDDFQDAAEFESRVAADLANPQYSPCWRGDSCLEFGGQKDEQWVWNCEWCRLKYARLIVEGEMDYEPKRKRMAELQKR